jgi:hypothetical protein
VRRPVRVALGAVSGTSAIVAVLAFVPLAYAQSGLPKELPISVTTPQGLDATRDIEFDPFVDTVDGVGRGRSGVGGGGGSGTSAGGAGASVGTPDVAYDQASPVDTSVNRGPSGTGSPNGSAQPLRPGGATASVTGKPMKSAPTYSSGPTSADPFDGLRYVGRVTGVPPLAVLRLASGAEVVYSVGDAFNGVRMVAVASDAIRFANGRIVRFAPAQAGGPSGLEALASPNGGASNLNRGALGTTPGLSGGNGVMAPIAGSAGSLVPILPGGPDSENAGHMPLSPAAPGMNPAVPSTTKPQPSGAHQQ